MTAPRRAALYLDAARHMRASQLAGRARRLVPPAILAAGLDRSPPSEWRPVAAGLGAAAAPQSGPVPPPEETGAFEAVGHRRPRVAPAFWSDPSDGLLFLFHLHGFEALASYAAGSHTPAADRFWAEVTEDWLVRHDRPEMPAWHPFPTANRVIAWAAALSSGLAWPTRLQSRVAAALSRQAHYLRRAIEHDIGGNHVLRNGTALVFAGAVLPGSSLLASGLRLLRREVPKQVLADGGHEERSTSYHREVLHDLEEVAELVDRTRAPAPSWLRDAVGRASSWQQALTGPEGSLPLLNDAWEGPLLAASPRGAVENLDASGHVVLRHGGDQAVLDVGPISPPHLPPHAHADVLSFVLWADGEPLVVDPGTFTYTGPDRSRFRGTPAHNTVEVDGEDQCLFWGDFRAASAPRVGPVCVRRHEGAVVVSATHDGYRRLSDPVVHHRTYVWWPGHGFVVVDRLAARTSHEVRSTLHLVPGARRDGMTTVGPFTLTVLGGEASNARALTGRYSPYLGREIAADVIEDRRAVRPGDAFGWAFLRDGGTAMIEHGTIVLSSYEGRLAVPLEALRS